MSSNFSIARFQYNNLGWNRANPQPDSLLSNDVTAALRAHLRGMHCAGGYIAAIALPIRLRFAVHRKRHFAVENNMRGKVVVGVIRVKRARAVLPHKCVGESFCLKLPAKFAFVRSSHDGQLADIFTAESYPAAEHNLEEFPAPNSAAWGC